MEKIGKYNDTPRDFTTKANLSSNNNSNINNNNDNNNNLRTNDGNSSKNVCWTS